MIGGYCCVYFNKAFKRDSQSNRLVSKELMIKKEKKFYYSERGENLGYNNIVMLLQRISDKIGRSKTVIINFLRVIQLRVLQQNIQKGLIFFQNNLKVLFSGLLQTK